MIAATLVLLAALAVAGLLVAGRRRRPLPRPPRIIGPHGGWRQEDPGGACVAVRRGPRHLGHVAGFGVPSDVFARYHRLKGNDVLMVSGTDEHGTPVMVVADRDGKSYGEVADFYNQSFREDFRRLGLSYDLFSRTTTLNHERVVQDLFKTLYEQGAIFERQMLVSFSPSTGHTLPDRYIEGTCPICGYAGGTRRPVRQLREPARSDRPDRAALQDRRLGPRVPRDEAPLPRPAAVRGAAPGLDREPDGLAAERQELLPRAARGAPCPADHPRPRLGRADPGRGLRRGRDKRIYVWFDAVIGYLSASIEWAAMTRRAGRLARVVAEPGGRALLLPGQGQHRLPHGDLAGDAARLRRRR